MGSASWLSTGILLYLSRIIAAVWIGRRLFGALKKTWQEAFFWPLVLGIFRLSLLRLIPVLGWTLRWVFLLVGLGAIWQTVCGSKREIPLSD